MSPGARWRALRVFGGAALATAALYLLLANVRWAELRDALAQARVAWVVAALGTTGLTLVMVTVRWRVLLGPPDEVAGRLKPAPTSDATTRREPLSWRALWDAVVIGQAVNIAFPLRFGEGARVAVTCAGTGRPAGGVTVAMAFERALDVTAFGAMILFLVAAGQMPRAFDGALPTILMLALATIAVVLLLVRFLPALLRWTRRRLRDESRLARWLAAQETSARAAWKGLARGRQLPILTLLTVLGLLSSAATNVLIFHAFDLSVPPIAAFVLLAVLQVGTAALSVPGNVGVFHYLTVLTLGAWDVPASLALATAIVLHAVSLGTRVVLGAISASFARGRASRGTDASRGASFARRPN